MKNFIKSFLISLLVSGSFTTNAMQKHNNDLEEAFAASLGVSLSTYLECKATADLLNVPIEQCLPDLPRPFEKQSTQQEKERQRQQMEWDEQMALRIAAQEEEEYQKHQLQRAEQLVREIVAQEKQARSFISQVNEKSEQFSLGEKRQLLETFMQIFNDLGNVAQHSDVHVLDNYVFGTGNNIRVLLEIGDLYKIDRPELTLAQTGQQMIEFMNNHLDLFKNYNYLGEPQTPQQISTIFNNYFSNMDTQVASLCPSAAQEVWSRAWTLALNLYTKNHDTDAIKVIFDQVVEGPSTRGGCPQGLIDRGFVGYVILLGKSGVGIH
jgi:flagellar biosynthesis GTPase FlhF